MDNYEKTLQSMASLDFKTREYVKQIVPMLLPSNAPEQEKIKLQQMLFKLVSLDVYNKQIQSTFNKFHAEVLRGGNPGNFYNLEEKHPDMNALELRYYLERTRPDMTYRNQPLSYSRHSKYSGEWQKNNAGLAITDSKRLQIEYGKRSWRKTSLKDYLNYADNKVHAQFVVLLRDFFLNGGTMDMINFNSKEFLALEQNVNMLRNNLMQKIYNLGAYQEYGRMYNPELFSSRNPLETDRIYTMTCENTKQFIEKYNILACERTLRREKHERTEKERMELELKALSKPIIEHFGKAFSELPTDERQHGAILNEIYIKVANEISRYPGVERTTKEQYVEIMQETYKKYMTQLKLHTLPIRLSYFPEDKEMYAKIVKEAREKQNIERKDGKPPISFESAIISGVGAVTAITAAMQSLSQGSYILPAAEAIALVSAPIINKMCERHRLLTDVEKRLGIRNKRIIQVRGFKSPSEMRKQLDAEKEQQYSFASKVYKAKVSLTQNFAQAPQFEGIPVEYSVIPDNPYKPHQYYNAYQSYQQENNEKIEKIPNSRRRADKYKQDMDFGEY